MTQASSFDLNEAAKCITEHGFQRVVCQFPDEYLECSTQVYLQLADQVPPECDIFIAADSAFGSSVDDISAAHVDADLLIFFGSDLSGSGSVNVMIVPPRKEISVQKCTDALLAALKHIDSAASGDRPEKEKEEEEGISLAAPTLLIFDPCYLHARDSLAASLSSHVPRLETGQLPACLGLTDVWVPTKTQGAVLVQGAPSELVGGVHFATRDVAQAGTVVYVGEKEEQLASLFLRLSQQRIVRYSPLAEVQTRTDSDTDTQDAGTGAGATVEVFQGDTTRVFRERYGGVSKVKAAKIIGLLVGSMGIETANLQAIVRQLQALIEAAGKKFYVFVLGRINEAKLCNFPEVKCIADVAVVAVVAAAAAAAAAVAVPVAIAILIAVVDSEPLCDTVSSSYVIIYV
jgi:diphthamide biosynthesis protein 2